MSVSIKLEKYLVFVVLISANFFSCAQSKSVIKKVYPFYIEHLPGIIAVDTNGNELTPRADTVIQIYAETTVKDILWDTAQLNGQFFLIITQAVVQNNVDVGILKEDGKKIAIVISKGNYLWQLYLEPTSKLPNSSSNNTLTLKGKYKGMIFSQKAGNPVQLETIPSM